MYMFNKKLRVVCKKKNTPMGPLKPDTVDENSRRQSPTKTFIRRNTIVIRYTAYDLGLTNSFLLAAKYKNSGIWAREYTEYGWSPIRVPTTGGVVKPEPVNRQSVNRAKLPNCALDQLKTQIPSALSITPGIRICRQLEYRRSYK